MDSDLDDATGALMQPAKSKEGRSQAYNKGHFFTAVVDCGAVLFDYAEHHTSKYVQKRFFGFSGYLQADASNVLRHPRAWPPKDDEDGMMLVGCWSGSRWRPELLRVLTEVKLHLDNTRAERAMQRSSSAAKPELSSASAPCRATGSCLRPSSAQG